MSAKQPLTSENVGSEPADPPVSRGLSVRRKTCRFHCSSCGRHFNGLAAFDLHLHRINQGKNRWGARTYDLEHSTDGLEVWTAEGYCDLTGSETALHPVSILRKPLTRADVSRIEKLKRGPGF